MWLPKHDLNRNNSNKHANTEEGKAHKALALDQELQATKNAERWRDSLSPGKSTAVTQYQMIVPKTTHI